MSKRNSVIGVVTNSELCEEVLSAIGRKLIEESKNISENLDGVKGIEIRGNIEPGRIAEFKIIKDYYATFKPYATEGQRVTDIVQKINQEAFEEHCKEQDKEGK